MVIIRPGDQILYEIKPGSWKRVDELDVAIAVGHSVSGFITNCKRCDRVVVERRIGSPSFWRSLFDRLTFRKTL